MGQCNLLKGAEQGCVGEGGSREGIYVYFWLIHIVVWQKPTQHCKNNYPPIKNELKKSKAQDTLITKLMSCTCVMARGEGRKYDPW